MRARLAAATVLALVVGCAPNEPTPSGGVTTNPTVLMPTGPATDAPPTATDTPPAATFGPDTAWLAQTSAVTVVVDRLPVRSGAAPGAQSHGDLVRGDVAVLWVFEPFEVDGVAWYYVERFPTPDPGRLPDLPVALPDQEFPLRGWIEARDATGETVELLPPRCPANADLVNVSAMLPGERLACFGGTAITLKGTFGCLDCASQDSGTYDPGWLFGTGGGRLANSSNGDVRPLLLNFAPDSSVPEEDARIRLTGHFDDPRAATCRMFDAGVATPQELAAAFCRHQFVVDSFEVESVEEIPPPE